MRTSKLCILTICLLVLIALGAHAQKQPTKNTGGKKQPVKKTTVQKPAPETKKPAVAEKPADPAQDEKKVKDMVTFLEFVLNTLGSSSTSSRDKDVLITQSYSKIFRDDKVQVEDDLDEERTVVTNKNVVAYLKDVDFFFRDVKFEFTLENIQGGLNADNKQFYKVTLKRNMSGTTTDGKPVNNTVSRYIEINYDPEQQDLKIASIYTNPFSEKETLINWWRDLSLEWKTIFVSRLNFTDSVGLEEIRKVLAVESLDLNNNTTLVDVEPLGILTKLKKLNLAGTRISNLSPIRNMTELTDLDISHTQIKELTPLKYFNQMARLRLNYSGITDIAVLQKMPHLTYLDLSGTEVTDITPLSDLTELTFLNLGSTKVTSLLPLDSLNSLKELNIKSSPVQDVGPLKGLKSLTILTLDSTRVSNLAPLSGLEGLTLLYANHTAVVDLQPLQKLTHLERIYCDKSGVHKDIADAFMAANRKVLVIYDSEDLLAWWNTLSSDWQEAFSKTAGMALTPTKEELARVPSIDSIDVGGAHINDLEPLRRLRKLRKVVARNTPISDLSPLSEHREITYLDISATEVSDISAARQFSRLKILVADNSKVQNIDPLGTLKGLERLYIDETGIHDIIAQEFLSLNPSCLLVYKTIHVNRWWSRLSNDWKDIFRSQMGKDTTATREHLHHLVELEAFRFKDAPVGDLSAFSEFVRLKELHFSGTSVSDLSPLSHLSGTLKSLHASACPLQQLESVHTLTELEDLDISNTPVEELKVLGGLKQLRTLNTAGTQIKKLDPLMQLEHLESLDCSNTRVGNLDPVSHRSLKSLKCYNTKVSTREIEGFKKSNPECSVVYYR